MENQPKVAAVVVTWNSRQDIPACLDSLISQTFPLSDIVVVDNASTDGTADLISSDYPQVRLLRQSRNEGFARGNNCGIAAVEADWILTINPDAYIDPDYVTKLLNYAENRPRIGALTGKLLSVDGRAIDSAGIEIYQSRRVKDRAHGLMDDGAWDAAERVFGVCAAAALYRREMLEDVAPDGVIFAESFFSYYEDADLAWRAWRRDWEAWYVPEAVGWHRRGGSPVGSRFSRYLTHRNRLWLIARNEPLCRLMGYPLPFFTHEFFMFLRMLRYPYLFKATYEAWRGLPEALSYRQLFKDVTQSKPTFAKGSGFYLSSAGRRS